MENLQQEENNEENKVEGVEEQNAETNNQENFVEESVPAQKDVGAKVLIFAIVAVVLVLGVIGYFVFGQNDNLVEDRMDATEEIENNNESDLMKSHFIKERDSDGNLQLAGVKVINVGDDDRYMVDMSDWVTYKSDKFGISFMHPPHAEIVEENGIINFKFLDFPVVVPTIKITENTESVTLLDLVKNKIYVYGAVREIVLNGYPGFNLMSESPAVESNFVSNKYIFEIVGLREILQSIKFSEEAGEFETDIKWPNDIKFIEETGEVIFEY